MQVVIAWFLSFIVGLAPPDRHQYLPAARESTDEASDRYESIAQDVFDVVYDKSNPPLFKGNDGRAKTAAVVLSVMWFESQFRKDVDFGVGDRSRGDSGRSWCLMQIQTGSGRTWAWNAAKNRFAEPRDPAEDVERGWTGAELTADRKKCILAGLRIARMSFNACAGLPVADRLRVYASGSCNKGARESEHRVGLAMRWVKRNPVPASDDTIFAELNGDQQREQQDDGILGAPYSGLYASTAPYFIRPMVDFLLPYNL